MKQQAKGSASPPEGEAPPRRRALGQRGALWQAAGWLFLIAVLIASAASPARATTTIIDSTWTGPVPITVNPGDEVDVTPGGSVANTAGAAVIVSGGTLDISGGAVAGAVDGIDIESGSLTISGGSVSDRTSSTPSGSSAGVTATGGTVTVSGGSVTGGVAGVSLNWVLSNGGEAAGDATLNVTGGSITSADNGLIVGGGTATISGGTVSSPDYGAWVPGGTLNITGGAVTGSNAVVGGGTINISGGSVTGRVSIGGPGEALNISGGSVRGDIANGDTFNPSLWPGGVVTITGCNLVIDPSTRRLAGTLLDGTPIDDPTSGPAPITLINSASCGSTSPVANAGSDQTVEATGPMTAVTLDGSGSNDPDGDALTYTWSEGSTVLGSGQKLGISLPLGEHTITLTVADPSGSSAMASVTITIVDTTPPAITAPGNLTAEATGPNGAMVSFSATAQDRVDGTVTVTCTPASGSTFPLGTTTVACTATDAHGNQAKATFTVTVQDTTPPVITVPGGLAATATSASGAVVNFSTSATDLVDGSVPVTASPASGATFPLGATAVHCTATDAHGNAGSASFTVAVTYDWSGVLPPINPDGSSVFRLGSTIPVKFQLTGASAGITDAVARLAYAKVSDGVVGDVNAADSTSAATTGNLFRYDPTSGQYIFNWSTQGLTTGTYQLQIDLGDGVRRMVTVGLK